MHDDFELLRQFANGASQEAFAELVRRHIGTVYSVALRRVGGDAHLADDVTQEVFRDLARKAASFGRRDSLVGWLFIATRYAAAKAVRGDQARQGIMQKAQEMIKQERGSSAEPDWEGVRPVLDELIHKLGDKDREAVLLYFFEKKTFGDLGARLSLSESGARMRVERALTKLRASLERRGITSTTAALAVALGGQAVAAVPSGLAVTVTTTALAGVNSGGAAHLLIMSITKTQLATAMAVILVGAAVMGVVQHREISALRAAKASAELEAAANGRRVSELAASLSADAAALAATRSQLSGLKSPAGTDGNAASTGVASGVKLIHLKDIIRDHPEFAALERKEERRSVVRDYYRAIASLNLSPDKAAQLKELLVERRTTASDAQDAATQAGFGPDSKEAGKAVSDATSEANQAITSLIGSEADEKLEALSGSGSFGQTGIDNVAVDLIDAGVSLSADQSQALSLSVHDLANSSKNPDAASPGYKQVDPTTWQSPMDQQFFAHAATILTPVQLQVFETSWVEENQRSAILKQYTGNEAAMITN